MDGSQFHHLKMTKTFDKIPIRSNTINPSRERLVDKSVHTLNTISSSVDPNTILLAPHKWREATMSDLPSIEALRDEQAIDFFGDVYLVSLIEQCPLSVVIEDVTERIVAFICLNNYPNISALLPEVWGDWMKHHYKLNDVQYQNTLFVHYIVWNRALRSDYLQIYLEDIFLSDVKLEYVCLVAPPNDAGYTFVRNAFIKVLFSRALPFGSYSTMRTQSLHICFRSSLVPKMKIRRALPEDNDDLVEILDATAPKLRNYYGDYYIAEIVTKNESNRSIIVAEINNQTVGMMCLNTDLDLEKLNKNFELVPFHALRKYRVKSGFEKIEIRDISLRESKLFFAGIEIESDENSLTLADFESASVVTNVSDYGFQTESQEAVNTLSEAALLRTLEGQISVDTQFIEFDTDLMKEWEELLQKYTEKYAYYDEYTKEVKLPLTEPNVMAIELYGMTSELDERTSIDLLKAAFDTYRDRDYCLLTIPSIAYWPKFLAYFTKVTPRPECSFPDDLYIIYKNNLSGILTVSTLEKDDLADLYNLLNYAGPNQCAPAEQIIEMCSDFVVNPKTIYKIVVISSEATIVGVVILRTALSMDHLRRIYCLDSYENFVVACSPDSYAQIVYCYMSPLFTSSHAFIFKEIFRITGYKSAFYSIRNDDQYLDFYNSLLPTMFPIKPRRVLMLPEMEIFDDIDPNTTAYEDPGTSAIYYTNLRLCTFQRKQIDVRIVVTGFGHSSKAFLETLLYRQESQHLRFTNITCICPAGILESDMTYDSTQNKLFSPDRLFNRDYLKQLEMRVWVNFVPGYMTKIDRKNKYIILDKKERILYDKLFLFCGVQFDVPVEVFNDKTPSNLVLINKSIHGKMIQYKIKNIVKKSGYKIIVYGCVAKAFAGINYLLNSGVRGEDISFVVSPLDRNEDVSVQTFDDDYVESVVYREMDSAGVNVYRNFKFVTWDTDKQTNMVKYITFESRFECIKLPCAMFISYSRKVVNRLTVKALNRSGLVFDGRIVIDADYRTNDPNIYAAGPLTKYRRILYADRYRHMYYNSKEIGIRLALKMINLFSQDNHEEGETDVPFKWIVPHYTFPLVQSLLLPGDFYYIHIRRPGVQLPNYLARSLDQYGTDLITGGSAKPQRAPTFLEERLTGKWNFLEEKLIAERDYCRMYLDRHGFVKTIVCLTKEACKGQNMVRLWGLHEKLLNNLKCKYQNGEITDFFEFFKERWTHILYHDRFHKLQDMHERIYRYNLDGNVEWLTEYLKKETNDGRHELSEHKRRALINYYHSKEFVQRIERSLLDFINEHHGTLFMYATPEILAKTYNKQQK